MDRNKLKQYRALQKEIPRIKKEIDLLYRRLEEVPVVFGTVTKSKDEFPYTKQRVTVQMQEPKAAGELKKQIRLREGRLLQAEKDKTEIEEFISSVPESTDRMIFELSYLEGEKMSQTKVGEAVGYSQGRVSQIIDRYLKN